MSVDVQGFLWLKVFVYDPITNNYDLLQDTKADVILKYTPDEARNLKSYGELPDNGMLFLVFSESFFLCKN